MDYSTLSNKLVEGFNGQMTMDKIMGCTLGASDDVSDTIRVTFKKTINTRQYESEVSEVEVTLKVPNSISGAERMLMTSILQAQAEYEVFCSLAFKGQITHQEFERRKEELTKAVSKILDKARALTGKNFDNIVN